KNLRERHPASLRLLWLGPGSRSCGKLPRFLRGWLDRNRDRQWRPWWGFAVLAVFVQQSLRDRIKRREHVLTGARDHFETLQPLFPVVQNVFHVIDRRDVREVALVVLEHTRDLFDHHVLKGEVVAEIFEALDVLLHFFPLRIGHENNSVHAAQHQLPGGVVNHLTGHGVELKLGHEPFDHERVQREEIEEKRALGGGGERNQIAAIQRIDPLMNIIQIGCLAAQRRTVINDFELNLAARVINDRHAGPPAARKCAKVSPPVWQFGCESAAAASPRRATLSYKCSLAQKNSGPSRSCKLLPPPANRVSSRARAERSVLGSRAPSRTNLGLRFPQAILRPNLNRLKK